jgi:hypothetical protein
LQVRPVHSPLHVRYFEPRIWPRLCHRRLSQWFLRRGQERI